MEMEEMAKAGKEALEIKESYPELADLSHEVVSDLVLQRFKCSACGEPVLDKAEPYVVVKWHYLSDHGENVVKYGCFLEKYWNEDIAEVVDVVKVVRP